MNIRHESPSRRFRGLPAGGKKRTDSTPRSPRGISLQERYSSRTAPVNIRGEETQHLGEGGTDLIMLGRLFRRTSLDAPPSDAMGPEHQLRRALGPLQLTLLGVGAIIGAGIFATIGTAAAGDLSRPGAGPALVVSF